MKYTGKYKEMAEQFQKDGCDEYTIEQFIRREMETDGFTKGGGTTDLEAVKLWKSYPDEIARYKSDDPTAVIQNWMRNRDDMVEQQT